MSMDENAGTPDSRLTNRAFARIAQTLAYGELHEPIFLALRAIAPQPPDREVAATISALTDLSCALNLVRAYTATPTQPSDGSLAYLLQRFGQTLSAYLARVSAMPPTITLTIIGVPQRLGPHVEQTLFRAIIELLLAAVDANSPAVGLALAIYDDFLFVRIWAPNHPWAYGEGRAVLEAETARLASVGISLVPNRTPGASTLTTELLLSGPGAMQSEGTDGHA
jgi:hypothetical protein